MSTPYPAALLLPGDAFDTEQHQMMGRRVAGRAFALGITAALQPGEQLTVLGGQAADLPRLQQLLQPALPQGSSVALRRGLDPDVLQELGCLHLPDPGLGQWSQLRNGLAPSSFSLTGVTHTLCSNNVIGALEQLISAPLHPWDALVCTSKAAQEVVSQAIACQRELLERRFGIAIPAVDGPQLPVIPLAIDPTPFCWQERFESRQEQRLAARQQLGISAECFVVLFVGRLSFHSKAHPQPLYRALQALAKRATGPVLLLECGHLYNPRIEAAYGELAQDYPGLRVQRLGGLTPATEAEKQLALAAADVFCSPADNLQETFGLSLLEAMASELPVVASNWSGYRDLVVDGGTGVLIPTATLTGEADDLDREFRLGLLDYDRMVGLRSIRVVVDQQALRQALQQLHDQPTWREALGRAGRTRLEQQFSWPVVAQHYRQLWLELRERRLAASASAEPPTPWPRSSSARLFGSFASQPLVLDALQISANSTPAEQLQRDMNREFVLQCCNTAQLTALVELLQRWQQQSQSTSSPMEINLSDGLAELGIPAKQHSALTATLLKLGIVEVIP